MSTSVHYGSLAMPLSAQGAVDEAFAYLAHSAAARAVIEHVEASRVPHRILIDHRHDDSYDPNTRTIRWDPTSALRTTDGGRQSPALGLVHELDHASLDGRAYDRLQAFAVGRYDSAEERRVITGSERSAARALHESTRRDHDGSVYRVGGPTERCPSTGSG